MHCITYAIQCEADKIATSFSSKIVSHISKKNTKHNSNLGANEVKLPFPSSFKTHEKWNAFYSSIYSHMHGGGKYNLLGARIQLKIIDFFQLVFCSLFGWNFSLSVPLFLSFSSSLSFSHSFIHSSVLSSPSASSAFSHPPCSAFF